MKRIFILLAGIVSLFASCRSTKKIQTAIAKKDTTATVIVPVDHSHEDSIAFIQDNYNAYTGNRINFTKFSAKYDVDYGRW
jgi:hypothetical protein